MDPGYGRQLLLFIPGISLSAAAAGDLRDGRIPNGLILLLTATGILTSISGPYGRPAYLLMPVLVTALFIPAWRMHGLGAGDVKLLAALSLWTDPESYIRCLAVSFFIAAGISLIVLITHVSKEWISKVWFYRRLNRVSRRFRIYDPESVSQHVSPSDPGSCPESGFRVSLFRPGRAEKKLRIHLAFPAFIGFLLHFGGLF